MKYFNKNPIYAGLVLLIAFLVIFWQFGIVPQKLAFDELEFARLALSLNGKWTIFSPQATGHATPYFYLLLLSFKIFGVNALALRLPAAILGVANSLLVFAVFQFYFQKHLAFLAAVIFTTLHWVFGFARFGFEATYLLFWELTVVVNLLAWIRKPRLINLALLIFGSIMSFYSYLPGRIFWLLPLTVLFLNKIKFKYIFAYLLIIFLAALPLLKASGGTENRVQELTYIAAPVSLANKAAYGLENLVKNAMMLNFRGDLNGRHNYPGKPGLNIFLGSLFWLGLALSLRNATKYRLFYFWAALSILPTLFTYPADNPHFLRTYSLTVSLAFFIALGVKFIWRKWPKSYYFLLALIIFSSLYEIRTYFKYQRQVFKKAFEKKPTDLYKLK